MAACPEVLAPAGDLDCLHAALAAGAGAVYFGLDDGFNARARAANFASDALAPVVETVHRAGAKAYVTMNTLVFEPELATVEELLRRIAAAGVDAVIVQDPAVALLARAVCPDLHVHASTQMTASSPQAAELLRPLGLDRVVVPRELSVEDIAAYAAGTSLPLEVFIHGALCVSWSGQCLTSESWGGRSANRGQCAQSCRLPYQLVVDGQVTDLGDVAYLLSPQDLMGLAAVPALAKLGVASLKIEGRLKGPSYVASAVTAYRDAVAAAGSGATELDERVVATLATAYSRGISAGFLGGVDHQRLVEGRFPRHRGLPIGVVTAIAGDVVTVRRDPSMRPWTGARGLEASGLAPDAAPGLLAPLPSPLGTPRPGVGVVFDGGRPELDEQGGPVFGVEPLPGDDGFRLRFGTPGPALDRVRVGDRVWLNSDPDVQKAGARAAERGTTPLGRIAVDLVVRGAVGAPLEVRAQIGPRRVVAHSRSNLAVASGGGLGIDVLRDKLGGFGGTAYQLGGLDTAGLPAGLHLPVSELKDVRRQLVSALEAAPATLRQLVDGPARPRVEAALTLVPPLTAPPLLVPLCRTDAQLDAALSAGVAEVELDWMELVGLARAVGRARAAGVRVVVATPRIQKPGEDKIDAHLARLAPDGVLVRSWGALATFSALADRPTLHGDFSLNVTNSLTARWVLARGLATLTCAHDLDEAQLQALLAAAPRGRLAVTVHHHIATFHTEHCVYAHQLSTGRDFRTCGRPCERHELGLTDRVGMTHPIVVDVGCRNTVFNAQAQSAAALVPSLQAAGVARFRVELVRESAREATAVIEAYQALLAGRLDAPGLVRALRTHEQFGVTRGTMRTLPVLPPISATR
jgi:putative protease